MRFVLMLAIAAALLGCEAEAPPPPAAPAAFPEAPALDKAFPGWAFPLLRADAEAAWRDADAEAERPNLAAGDFDGDGQTDYAAHIVYPRSGTPHLALVVVLSGSEPKVRLVEEHPVGADSLALFLTSRHRGESVYDYEAGSNQTLARDAFVETLYEKSSLAYVYADTAFRRIILSD